MSFFLKGGVFFYCEKSIAAVEFPEKCSAMIERGLQGKC